jgi:hypothetical protein
MLDEHKSETSVGGSWEDAMASEERVDEARIAYLMSPEFTRLLCEHFQRATRRAIDERKELDATLNATGQA